MVKYYFSPAKQKIVLLLASGAMLLLSPSPKTKWRIIKNLPKEWKNIDRDILRRVIKEFKYGRLVDFKEEKDGTISVILNEKGKKHAIQYDIENLKIKIPLRWDRKWRIVIFDIPEKRKAAREALRRKLIDLGFCQIQKSVWVSPYECKNEIDFLVEFFEVRDHVHYIVTSEVSQDEKLRLHFNLS